MARSFDLAELEGDDIREFANINEKNYAYSLLRTSGFSEEQKEAYDYELSDDMTIYRLDSIIMDLKNNQSDPINMSQKEINLILNRVLLKDERHDRKN